MEPEEQPRRYKPAVLKRIATLALSSFLLVEPILAPNAFGADGKVFKKQTSNSIKVDGMGDKMGALKTKIDVKEQARMDIYGLLNATEPGKKVEVFNRINDLRETKKDQNYIKAYSAEWSKLSKANQNNFSKNWRDAAELVKEDSSKSLVEALKRKMPNTRSIEFYVSGSGTEETAAYDALVKIERNDGKTKWLGIKGSRTGEYGYSYEFYGERTQKDKEIKEWEVWGKDFVAVLSNWDGARGRFAQFRQSLIETNSSTYFFVSGETGIGSYVNIKQEPDGSTTLNLQGSPSSFNALWQKVVNDKEFYKYTGTWQAISNIGLINNINSVTDLSAKQMMLANGDLKVQMTIDGKKATEIYKGGTIKVKDHFIAISSPFIEKTPDMERPEMYVLIYKMDKKGNFIGSEKIEIANEETLSIGDSAFNLKVTPSKNSMSQVVNLLKSETYVLHIEGMAIPLTPSVNNSYIYHSKDGDYKVTLNSIKPIEPILSSKLNLQGDLTILNMRTNETKSAILDLRNENRIKIGETALRIKLDPPDNMTITNSAEYVSARYNLDTTRMTNREGDIYYLNTLAYNGTMRSKIFGDQEIQMGGKLITLSTGPFEEKQKELEAKKSLTTKEQEKRREELARTQALGTALGIKAENIVGLSFNANNSTGQGIWGVVYNPTPLIESGVTSSGDALSQLTVKTKKVGWDSLALTGMTAYEQKQLAKEDEKIENLKDVTGLGLWLAFDTYALHGEGKVTTEAVEELVTRNVDVKTKGTRKEAIFSSFDPNREGFQILSLRYNKEQKAGSASGTTVDILRSDYSTSAGYRKDLEHKWINAMYGKLDLQGYRSANEYIMSSSGMTTEQLAESVFDRWNPVFGMSTTMGAYEIGIKGATTEEYNRIKSQSASTVNWTETKEKGYNLIVKGFPILNALGADWEIDASYDQTKRDSITTRNDILNSVSAGKDQIIELQPIAKIGPDSYAYLKINTQLSETMTKTGTSKTEITTRRKEIRPGYKNAWMELNTFYITNEEETATNIINSLSKTRQKQKQLGLTLFGKASEEVGFNLSYSKTIDSSGTSWLINGGLSVKLGPGKKEKK